jgi:hypothetical protein
MGGEQRTARSTHAGSGQEAPRNSVFPYDCEGRLASLATVVSIGVSEQGTEEAGLAGPPHPPGRATQSSASCPRISPPGFATVWTFA